MKYILNVLLITLLGITSAWATPVGPMNYQGQLLDDAGIPVTGSYNFVVKIYDDPVAGILKYQESHNSLNVDDGVYSFKVGTGTNVTGNWDIDLWQGNLNDLFLELVVNGETLTPRHELTSAPHAFTATLALSAGALGNKTAAQFDNILEGVCVASKGIWLEKVGKCLGAGTSFPGPTLAALSTLTDKTDLSNLDLSGADISGINFSANSNIFGPLTSLVGSIFKNTTYSVQGLSKTNIAKSQWDGAIATDASSYPVANQTNLDSVTFKNMDMSKWGLSNLWQSNYLSAAYLGACPSSLFGNGDYQCKPMHGSNAPYVIVGPAMNFSNSSAAAITSDGEATLDLDSDIFADIDLTASGFTGVTVTHNFTNGSLHNVDFSNARLRNVTIDGANLAGSTFVSGQLENVEFKNVPTMNFINFQNASLSHVMFSDTVGSPDFTGAVLKEVDFTGNLGQATFANAVLEDVRINYFYSNWATITFDNTRIYGRFHVADLQYGNPEYLEMKDVKFLGATVSGDFTGALFTGTPVFRNTIFENIDLCATTIPLAGAAPHTELASVLWRRNNECPDGTDIGGGGTCDTGARMTPTAVVNCTAGLPIPN